MAISTKTIKTKLKSIKNLKKITKTMEMISAVKTRKLLERVFKSKYYAEYAFELLVNISKDNKENDNIFFKNRSTNKILVIIISSNKGLCGSYNSNIFKRLKDFVLINKDKKIDCITIGKYSEKFARKLNINIKASFLNFNEKFSEKDIYPLSKIIKTEFLESEYENISFIYTNFISPIKNETKVSKILPISNENILDVIEHLDNKKNKDIDEKIYKEKDLKRSFYQYEPNINRVLDKIIEMMLNVNMYQFILESLTSEENSRMSAMKNATENASDMIDELNLFYNKTRQANITQEIIEVISGSNAIN